MQQLLAVVIVLLLVVFTFIPASFLSFNNLNSESIKQTLNLSARVLANSVKESEINFHELSQGTKRRESSQIEIDKDKLLDEFYDLLNKNILDSGKVAYVKSHLPVKALVYYDKFFIAGADDRWEPPYFFTGHIGDKLVYFNTKNNSAYYYDTDGGRIDTTVKDLDITEEQKNEIVIQSLNRIVSQKTYETGLRKGLKIEIYNPYTNDPGYKVKHSYFNVLDGITFFVVYADDIHMDINLKQFKYSNYNVVGYTLE